MDNTEIVEIYEKIKHESHRFEGKTILITGCCGFLGKIFTHLFLHINKYLKSPCTIYGCDNFIIGAPKLDIEDPNFIFLNHDITLPLVSKLDKKMDFILACHGIADPKIYIKYGKETLDGSYFGSFNILDVAKEHKSESIVLFSSSEVIGGFADTIVPTPEMDRVCYPPKGERAPYDTSKVLCLVISDLYYRKYGINVKNILPFNAFSSNLPLRDNRLLANFMNQSVQGKPLKVYGQGLETRTLVHAIDLIYGCILVLLNGRPNQHYNIGNDRPEMSVKDLAALVSSITGATIEFVAADPVYASQPKRRAPDITLARTELGYNPTISLEDGIRRYWKWAKENYNP